MQRLYSLPSSSKPPRLEPVSRPRSRQPLPRPSVPALPSPCPAFIPPKTLPQPIRPKLDADPQADTVRAHIFATPTQNYSSSGSNHDPSSVCLAAMVHEFLEEEARVGSCGRARCNCLDGACGEDQGCGDPSETDDLEPIDGEQFCEILEGVTSCTSTTELLLLADVANALEAETEDILNALNEEEGSKAIVGNLRRPVMKRLRQAGHDAGLCKSRWNHAKGLPGGDYEYVDVLLAKNGKHDRFIVDTDFKAQFEIARASKQYGELLNVLPRIFVGRPERLKQILKIMSDAAKRSLKKQGLLLPPWRKLRYLQAKWFSSYRRTTNEQPQTPQRSEESLGFLALRGPRFCLEFTKEMDMFYFRAQSQASKRDSILDKREIFCEEREIFRPVKRTAEGFVKAKNETFLEQRDICTVMCTDWQLPAVNAKTEFQRHRISGLANALQEAGICLASTLQKPLQDLAKQQIVRVVS